MPVTAPRTITALALVSVALAAMPAVASARPWNPDRKVVVAVEAPMSGEGKDDGLDQLRGVELAARDGKNPPSRSKRADSSRDSTPS